MAEDNLNEILKNYKNMSMENLGSVLLQRQAHNRRRVRRKQKREDRILKIMAVLLGGQAVFQENYKNRAAEIDSLHTIAKKRNQKMAAEMVIVGGVLKALPEELIRSDNAWARYMEESKQGDAYQKLARDSIYAQVLKTMTDIDPDGVKSRALGKTLKASIHDIIDDVIMPYYLKSEDGKKSRALQLMEAGEAYFDDPTITGAKVFEKMFGISTNDIDMKRATRFNKEKQRIQKGGSWFDVPGMIGQVFRGESTIFAKQTGVEASALEQLLDRDIELGKFYTPHYSEAMAKWNNSRNYYNEGLGDEKLLSRDPGGMQDVALRQVIYQEREIVSNLNAGAKERLGGPVYEKLVKEKLDLLEEAEFMLKGLYGTPEQRNQLDESFGNDVAKIFAGLRVAIDDTTGKGAKMLEEKYGVDLDSMNIEDRNVFAMRVILKEGLDPVQPDEYRDLPKYQRRGVGRNLGMFPSPLAGELELFERGGRYRGAARKPFNESNFVNNLSNVMAYIKPTFTGVDEDGHIKVNSDIDKLLDSSSHSDNVTGANIIATASNDIAKRGLIDENQALLEDLIKNNPGLLKIVNAAYDDVPSFIEAGQSGNIDFGMDDLQARLAALEGSQQGRQFTTQERERQIFQPEEVEMMKNIGASIGSAWTGQVDKQAETTVERHLSGSVKNRAGYQKALIRLGITDEEARAKYSSPLMVE